MSAVAGDIRAVTAPKARAEGTAREAEDAELGRLFDEIGAGSRDALESLYRLMAGPVFGLAMWRAGSREDAADVVQETFLKVARVRDRLAEVRRPRVWLLTIAHRLAVDVTRGRSRHHPEPETVLELLVAPAHDPGRSVDAERASGLLADLPPKQREVVFLHHYQGLTFAAIGEVVGVPTFTAASRYRLGIATLRRALEVVS